MGTVSRGSKSTGGTSLASGAVILNDELDTDFDTLYTLVNGNIDNANVNATAAIAATKIDDASATATAMATVTNPGTVDGESLPTTLAGEIERLRYVAGRTALGSTGSDVKRNDGSSKNVPWYHGGSVRGRSVIRNGSFETQTAGAGEAPDGWTKVGAPGTLTLVDTDVTNGDGKAVRIVAGAAGQGISQSLAGLRASSQYLITARIKVAVGTVRLVTTGANASSEFRNVDISSTSATATNIAAIVQTDATPTAIVVQFLSNANLDDFQVDNVEVKLVNASHNAHTGYLAIQDYSIGTGTVDTVRDGFPEGDELSVSITVPGPGYYIKVSGYCCFTDNAANSMGVMLVEDDGSAADVAASSGAIGSGEVGSVPISFLQTAPTPGATYTYTVESMLRTGAGTANGTVGSITIGSLLMAELIPAG